MNLNPLGRHGLLKKKKAINFFEKLYYVVAWFYLTLKKTKFDS